jgi:Isochorismatase family
MKTTTSGCVRATVVDAFSLNYRVTLAEEGGFDRSEASHAVSLCDMHAKYADIVSTAEILSYFTGLPDDLRPAGRQRQPSADQGSGRIRLRNGVWRPGGSRLIPYFELRPSPRCNHGKPSSGNMCLAG